jgi:transcriptional regulator with XRE-family HTH domain
MEQTKKKAGEFIKNARLEKRFTQAELAALVGIGTSMMSMIESGHSFSVDTSDALAVALDLDPNALRSIAELPQIDDVALLRASQYAHLDIDTRRPLVLNAIRKLLRLSDDSLRIVIQQMGAFPDDREVGSPSKGDSKTTGAVPKRPGPRRRRND